MNTIQLVGMVLYYAISAYVFVLLLRVVLDWVRLLARDWRPKGIILVLANFVYGITDPPVKFFGRLIPPLRIGGLALDMGFLVLFFLLFIAQTLILKFMF